MKAYQILLLVLLGLLDDGKKCLLVILTYKYNGSEDYDWKLHLYTYHLRDEGIIGSSYTGEQVVRIDTEILKNSVMSYGRIAMFNNNIKQFCLLFSHFTFFSTSGNSKIQMYDLSSSENLYKSDEINFPSNDYEINLDQIIVSPDDKFIYPVGTSDDDHNRKLFEINTSVKNDYSIIKIKSLGYKDIVNINNTTNFVYCYSSDSSKVASILKIIDMSGDTSTELKTIYVKSGGIKFQQVKITLDNKYLICIDLKSYIYVYDFQEILNASEEYMTGEKQIEYKQFEVLYLKTSISSGYYNITTNVIGQRMMISSDYTVSRLNHIIFKSNEEDLIGIKYKNQYFYNIKQQNLTAESTDVKNGKTFIGFDGVSQTGTMEV